MENKINVAELLKDCPRDMELDCAMYENAKLDYIASESMIFSIKIQTPDGQIGLNKYGCYSNNKDAKCVIFPKGKTTWEGFQRPFKDGDIVFYNDIIAIFKEWGDETLFRTYVTKYLYCNSLIDTNVPLFGKSIRKEIRFATEKEKQKLFDAIKAKGYKWNPDTKTLEKLFISKFKVGDIIRSKISKRKYTIRDIKDDVYIIYADGEKYGYHITFDLECNYELVPNKFDISTLKPFESRVLVRDANCYNWEADIFGRYSDGCITLGGAKWERCIPYEGNEHLLGTNDDCVEFYKNW